MSRRAGFTLQHAKRAVAPFFFEGWFAIGLLFIAAVGLTFALTGANAAAESLFQSPQSPVGAPAPQPVQAAPPGNPPAATEPQPAQPAPDNPDTAAPPAQDQPQPAPSDANLPVPAGEEAPLPPPLPEPERRPVRDTEPPSGADAQMVLDQAEFIDTVVVSFAYVWLCCGIVLILVIPLIFLFLHIRGRSKIIKEEQY